MKKNIAPPLALGLLAMMAPSHAAINILNEGDFIIAIQSRGSRYPGGEPPSNAIDGTAGKYLNFGGNGSGFIVELQNPSTIQSFTWMSGGDVATSGRNPLSYEIYGTNDVIASADGSRGLGESWTLVTSGGDLPNLGNSTLSGVTSFSNIVAYNAYKVVFPTVHGGTSSLFEIGEFSLYESSDGTGATIYTAQGVNSVRAIGTQTASSTPPTEGPENLLVDSGKYLNFGRRGGNPGVGGAGVIVTPAVGPTIVESIRFTAGGDTTSNGGRTPTSFSIYGTNDSITSTAHGFGDEENWVPIVEDYSLVGLLENQNNAISPIIDFTNDQTYASYKIVFPTLVNNGGFLELARVEIFAVPEPGVTLLSGIALLGLGIRRRR